MVKNFTGADYAGVLSQMHKVYGSADVKTLEEQFRDPTTNQTFYAKATHQQNGQTEYRWTDLDENGLMAEHIRFSFDPISIDIVCKPLSGDDRIATEQVTINDPNNKTTLTFDVVEVLNPRHFRINGKAADTQIDRNVEKEILEASEGRQLMTEDNFLEEALIQIEKGHKGGITCQNPDVIRGMVQQLLQMREAFNKLDRTPD